MPKYLKLVTALLMSVILIVGYTSPVFAESLHKDETLPVIKGCAELEDLSKENSSLSLEHEGEVDTLCGDIVTSIPSIPQTEIPTSDENVELEVVVPTTPSEDTQTEPKKEPVLQEVKQENPIVTMPSTVKVVESSIPEKKVSTPSKKKEKGVKVGKVETNASSNRVEPVLEPKQEEEKIAETQSVEAKKEEYTFSNPYKNHFSSETSKKKFTTK